ncbi:MAG: class I SAM-dependent methyltransferase [Candidatus Marinimicrobia bacterium]|nr:class I SAM-dependent methyltransferase [Candidatus Neomarinimicrobiota bacterium]
MKTLKTISIFYHKLSKPGKILVFIAILLLLIVFFKAMNPVKEGMVTSDKFLFKQGDDVYDNFYAGIYDYLVFNGIRNDYEVGEIINKTKPTEASVIVDIGCGTGHQAANLSSKGLNVIGVDISPSMIEKAKEQYPTLNFQVGDALDNGLFKMNSITHILCLYFTIYYFKDKRHFFDNCIDWLMPGGYLIVHLVDRETFDPILPPGNPLYIVSPQKYAKERITKTKIVFNDFDYTANFNLEKDNNLATFDEKFKFSDGKVRKQQQKLYMDDTSVIINAAQDAGFILQGKIDLLKCAYENQYLYMFTRPS